MSGETWSAGGGTCLGDRTAAAVRRCSTGLYRRRSVALRFVHFMRQISATYHILYSCQHVLRSYSTALAGLRRLALTRLPCGLARLQDAEEGTCFGGATCMAFLLL